MVTKENRSGGADVEERLQESLGPAWTPVVSVREEGESSASNSGTESLSEQWASRSSW